MSERLYPTDDFEATIRIYNTAEGGRRSPVFNGIRWDFAYADQQSGGTLYMIWPDFVDVDGRSRNDPTPLPVGENLSARMFIVVDAMREKIHRARIAPGVRFYCHEGGKRVAEGIVTRVTGLELRPFPPVSKSARTPSRRR